MSFTENKGTKIYWNEEGQGTPVLMLMGLGWASNMWHRTRPLLAARYRTVAFDNRGAGRSDVPPGPYSMATMASDAAAVLDAAGITAAHLLGVSMGGMIAQEFALQYPHRVHSLTLACTTPGGPHSLRPEPAVIEALFRTGLSAEQRAKEAVPYLYDSRTPQDRIDQDLAELSKWYPVPLGVLAQQGAILAWEAYDRLDRIAAPTLVLHGVNDRLVPAGNADFIARRIRGAQLVKLADAAHILFTDRPVEVHRIVLGFLSAQPAGRQ